MGNWPCVPSVEDLVPTANQIADAPEDIVIAEKVDDKTPGESGGHGLQEQPLDPSEVKEISNHAATTTAADDPALELDKLIGRAFQALDPFAILNQDGAKIEFSRSIWDFDSKNSSNSSSSSSAAAAEDLSTAAAEIKMLDDRKSTVSDNDQQEIIPGLKLNLGW